jgi:micrococcal nuclease
MITEPLRPPGPQTAPSDQIRCDSPRTVRKTLRCALAVAASIPLVFGAAACGKLDGPEREGRVVAVVDGDTIVVAGVGAVRYIGIDTPELHHPRKPLQRMARAALRANRELVAGRRVRLVFGRETHDVYGRTLAYVYVGDTMINAELVRRGLAHTLPIAPNTRHAAAFAALERSARRLGLGLWGSGEGGPPWGVP